jgi:hypothetical protein
MIAQVLNRQWVREQLEEVERYLSSSEAVERRRGPLTAAEVGPEDLEEALVHVRQALGRETTESSGQPAYEPPIAERLGEQAPPLDDFSFFSRDPVISNLQAALEEYLEQSTVAEERIEQAEPLDDRRRGPGDDVAVTDRALASLPPGRQLDGRRLFDRFSVTDIGWVSSAMAMGIRLFRKRHAFHDTPAEPIRIANRARLVLVGDWASGLPRAAKVANEMRKVLDEGKGNREQHVIHLADTYYAGWQREFEKRFLPYWPVQPDEANEIGSYALNGNHEMYSGGYGYYDYLLKDDRFKRQAGCSYFALVNPHWKILSLDTAWEENSLKDPQPDWVQAQLRDYQGKVMLLSHHQLFSAYETVGDLLPRKLSDALGRGINAWFWGHEHRCMLYQPHENVQYGRCIGHGGVPVYMTHQQDDPYPSPAVYEYREYIDKGIEHWALMGFAVLDFEEGSVHVRYIDENGTTHKEETIS